jgi:hypothetical protein
MLTFFDACPEQGNSNAVTSDQVGAHLQNGWFRLPRCCCLPRRQSDFIALWGRKLRAQERQYLKVGGREAF